jgi:hypothetical protein
MALNDQTFIFQGAGLNQDDAPELVRGDYTLAINGRVTGTASGEGGYFTNIESNVALTGSLLPGVNNVIGGGKFDDTGEILAFRFNSAGNCQILLYEASTQSYSVLYTDKTDSGGQTLLPLNPQNTVTAILVNKTYVIWWAKDIEVGCSNLNTLKSGGYGSTFLWEDLSLLKPQCMIPPTGVYGSDEGTPSNYLYGNLGQFAVQYVNDDFNYSTWSTWSKRLTPFQENTPTLGSDVSKNNYIIVTVNIGSIRAAFVNIACRFGLNIFYNIKSVTRAYILALPNSTVDVSTEIFEAYDAGTNTYSFAFYNNTINIPIATQETNLNFDEIWPSNAGALINGNIVGLGDWKTLYARPNTSVTIGAVGYNPNIGIPAGTYPDPLRTAGNFPGSSGSGAGDHKRIMSITLGGTPHTNDKIITITADIRNANAVRNYTYIVPLALDGNLAGVVAAYLPFFPRSSSVANGDGTYTITWIDEPYYGLQQFSVQLFFSGASTSNSIPSVLDNSQGQLALSYRDYKSRFLPLSTGNNYMWTSPSYAQVNGNAIELSWQINDVAAPDGAVDYQWVITAPPVLRIVDTIVTLLIFKTGWNSSSNSPSLSVNDSTAKVGDTYQVTTPSSPISATYHDLGHNDTYNTGDYIIYNGQSYDLVQKDFGDLANNTILAFSLNSLHLYDSTYQQQGVDTIVAYDFAVGDRCTLHYWIDGSGDINYFNQPCIDLSILGYDAGNFIVKVENSAALTYSAGHVYYNGNQIDGMNIFLRLYSPALQNQSSQTAVQSTTVWYEIGERFPVVNGQHSVLSGSITDGGVYFKTRQFLDGILPYADPPIETIATDLNYSDFYPSAFWSAGRTRTYYDQLEQTTRAASIITSQNYITGSKNNGLNRFYPSTIYGESNGQTSSSQGEIQIIWQRGQELVILQELGVFYIPVNEVYTVVNDDITGQSISSKLLNNGRYASENVGIGTLKESFCTRFDLAYFISPQYSEPFEIHLTAGVQPYSGKMSKFFKSIIQLAYQQGKKLHQYYNDFYEEVVLCIQAESGIVVAFPFNTTNWNPMNSFVITPSDVTATANGAHCTASYDSGTGIVTYTPTTNYVGTDSATFSFNSAGSHTVNNCLEWTAGSGEIDIIYFTPQTGVPLSTVITSNTGLVSGMDYPVSISITGGEYSVNGGAYTSSAGTVVSGDVVQVRQTSSGSYNTMTVAALTISSPVSTLVANFNVTTVTGAGGYVIQAAYGMGIDYVTDGTATGTPAAFGTANLAPGNSMTEPYTAITAGTVLVSLSGTPTFPGHVYLKLFINSIEIQSIPLSFSAVKTLTFPATSDPTPILINIAYTP